MPAPVMSQSRGPAKGTKRSQDHQQPPAKRAKLSKAQSTAPTKGLAAAVLPRPGEAKKALQAASNGFKDDIRLHKVDESTATIASGPAVQDVEMEDDDGDDSSEVVEDSEYDSEDDSDDSNAINGETQPTKTNTTKNSAKVNGVLRNKDDTNSSDEDDSSEAGGKEDDQEQEDQAPSFGELLLASTTEPIDVEAAALNDPTVDGTSTLAAPQEHQRALSIPAGASLTTLLTQALRTHDKDLLETCLQTTSLDTIRSTIERLDPTLATALLHRVAERLHKRPGRAASLMVWVQWTLVAHGGYLVAQPSVVRKVGELYGVICERARSLPWLLQLKGKLDMLAAQLEVRRNVEVRQEMGPNDDEAVIYVEGEEEDEEEDMDGEVGLGRGRKAGLVRRRGADLDDDDIDENDEDDDLADEDADDGLEMPMGAFDEDDEDEDEQDSDEDLLDDEAEETDRDTGDDRSEVESEEDEEGESIDESGESEDDEHSPVRRSTAVQRRSKKAF